jgi:integrase
MPDKKETTLVLFDRQLILYQRERSNVWQCRYKVDGKWQRATTKERDLAKAKAKAQELLIEAEIRKRNNLPVVTRRFRDVAKLALARMKAEEDGGNHKASYKDYAKVINDYLIPCLGKYTITNIDYAALNHLDAWRIERMKKVPTQSTMMTHNAALNRVFDEAVLRGFLTEASRPKLESKGKKSTRRVAFDLEEVRALLGSFDAWIERATKKKSKPLRVLLRDYVTVLLDTGARPGKELMNLKWKQIRIDWKPVFTPTPYVDEDGEPIEQYIPNKSALMTVSGKTGMREIAGNVNTLMALRRIVKSNYNDTSLEKLIETKSDDYVFRTSDGEKPTSFQNLFCSYLKEHNLLIDPITEQKRVFYSLRHTYATFALQHDKVPIHTLAKQMGTSVNMIEKHYSHLKVVQAIDQLRGEETRQLLTASGVINEIYKSNKESQQ